MQHIDFSTLRLAPGSFVDDALRGAYSDLLFTVQFAGKPALIYFLFEHLSTVDGLVPLRLARYLVNIIEKHVEGATLRKTAKRRTAKRKTALVADIPADVIVQRLTALAPGTEEDVMTPAEQWKAEGREKGRVEGRVEMLLRQLTVRFGKLPVSIQRGDPVRQRPLPPRP